jgi:hypothetical protein
VPPNFNCGSGRITFHGFNIHSDIFRLFEPNFLNYFGDFTRLLLAAFPAEAQQLEHAISQIQPNRSEEPEGHLPANRPNPENCAITPQIWDNRRDLKGGA